VKAKSGKARPHLPHLQDLDSPSTAAHGTASAPPATVFHSLFPYKKKSRFVGEEAAQVHAI
jgi:hypothetical protein